MNNLRTKNALFLFLLLIAQLGLASNGNIKGKVKLADGTPATFATVYIASLQKHDVTTMEGCFTLKDIPYGTYNIEVTTVEAKPRAVQVTLSKAAHTLDIQLEENPAHKLDEVVVVGKSEGQQMKDKGFALSLVDTKETKLTTLDASDLLDRTSGIKLRQEGGLGSEVQYNINGLSGNSVRIFIDGIPLRNYGSSFSLSSIPPSMIERIELYKGVVPATLSEDALGGAVNVVLKQSYANNLATSYTYGSFNTHKWDINGNYQHDKTGFTVGGSAFYNYSDNNYKVWGDPIKVTDPQSGKMTKVTAKRFHDAYSSVGVNGFIGFNRVKWADRLLLGGLYSQMGKDIQHGATMNVVYGNRFSKQNTKMLNLRYEKKNILPKLDVSLYTSYSLVNSQVIDTIPFMYNWLGEIMVDREGDPISWNKGGGEAGKATDAMNIENSLAGRYRINYRFVPNHSISANMLYNKFSRDVEDSFLPKPEQLLTDTRHMAKQILSLAYESRLLNEKLSLSLFYKYYNQQVQLTDPRNVDGSIVANEINRTAQGDGFGGAASYQLLSNLTFTLSGEKAIRLPENNELLGNASTNVQSSYDLKPEKSTNLNVGVLAGPFKLGRHTVGIDANLFYRDVSDMIQKGLTNLTDEMYGYENLGKVLSKGFDVDLHYNFDQKLFVEAGFSNFNARYNLQYDEAGVEYLYYKDRLRNTPYLTANGNVQYVHPDLFMKDALFTWTYNLSYVHEFFRNWESLGGSGKSIIPTQLVHDIGFVYTFPKRKISVGFDVRNLLNEQVFDNWALQKPGRAFFAKVTYNIYN